MGKRIKKDNCKGGGTMVKKKKKKKKQQKKGEESRSNLEAGSQKLPVLQESTQAWSWIILPKGIFIGRECTQKRVHCYKGTAL